MANPVLIVLPKGVWVKVADGVTQGHLQLKKYDFNNYIKTQRDAGEPAPTDDTLAVDVKADEMYINSSVAIDVYLKAIRNAGSVIAIL
jgi:hypothetical protein